MNNAARQIGNRASGLAMLVFGGILASTDSLILDSGAALFMMEGVGDLISGKHHYISANVLRYISRGRINLNYESEARAK